ncbi:hypothetical protein DNHGIG_25280 [Collibacillus ludicampi]|uniref:Uncharacterized protein n=1 Tax=Collibacillus ludicampi TaxID=2771369 RepID=A0AAV4LGQ1_9BACL|nr:hypothetical protein [Collibacillus ludicampi]GIM46979.1 hypothetical protein DNHGIG_25280 [Collibacillus ludicampi]
MSRRRHRARIKMDITNGDLLISYLKVNSVSNSGTVILGDAERITPRAVTFTRGVTPETVFAPSGPGGPTGAVGVIR